MIYKLRIGREMEGIGSGIIEALSHNVSEVTDVNADG
jgi:hypothetical protein